MTARAIAGAIEQEESQATLGASSARSYECDACGRSFEGEPAGAGLFLWTRGDEVRYEEPPLCEQCASKITVGALLKWDTEDEDEG
jgi:hypothetical protein